MFFLAARDGLVYGSEEASARAAAHAIESAGFHQAFEHALIQEFRLDGFAEFEKACGSARR